MINKLKTSTAGASDKAANILNIGGIVAFPTETVYGLGADARNEEAVLIPISMRKYTIKNSKKKTLIYLKAMPK